MFRFILFLLVFCYHAKAALPFVTDDAAIQNKGQFAIETFTEGWYIPPHPITGGSSSSLYGQYISGSYGISKHFEATVGGMIGYDLMQHSNTYSNLIFQVKAKILEINHASNIPGIAIDFGYVTKSGKGEYYDNAENFYVIGAATKYFFNGYLITHLNIGAKASYRLNIPDGNIIRPHVGIGFDVAPFVNKNIRMIVESYNGAPNSPRDSNGYFHSYQIGMKFIQNKTLSFHVLYGTQPTFAGYNSSYNPVYRQTQWIQFGIRKVLH